MFMESLTTGPELENDGVVGRIDVEADDLFELGRELRIIRQLNRMKKGRSG
jgi:hypothetical protein